MKPYYETNGDGGMNEEYKILYEAANNVLTAIGEKGRLDSESLEISELSNAMYAIDGGLYDPVIEDSK